MTIIVKPPQYDYHGLSISQYTIILIYYPSLTITDPHLIQQSPLYLQLPLRNTTLL